MNRLRGLPLALAIVSASLPAWAAVDVASFTASSASSGTTSRTPSEPSGATSGNGIVAFCARNGDTIDGSWTDPADFTQIAVKDETTGNLDATFYLGYKIRGADAGSGYTFTYNGTSAQSMICALLRITGASAANFLDVAYVEGTHYGAANNALTTAPRAITTVTDNAMVLTLQHFTNVVTSVGPSSGYTEEMILEADLSIVNSRHLYVQSKIKATAGAETPGVYTHVDDGADSDPRNFTIAIRDVASDSPLITALALGTTTSTTAPITFTVNQTGTLEGVACPDGQTFPTVTQVLADNCTGDVAAVSSFDEAVTANTPDGETFTGLTASTTYDLHFACSGCSGGNSAAISTISNAMTASGSAPVFDTPLSVQSQTTSAYTLFYNASAGADNIYVAAFAKDASTPTCDAIESGTGDIVNATEATTGSDDTIVLTIPGGDPFPLYDIYGCLEDGSTDSSVAALLDEALDVPSGRQYVVKAGAPGIGQLGLLDDASPAAVNGDIMDVSTLSTSAELGAAAHVVVVNADTTYQVKTAFEDDGTTPLDTPDASRQLITRRFYDVSTAAWSDAAPVNYFVNNQAPVWVGLDSFEGSVPFIFERNAAVSLLMDSLWDDAEDDALTHEVDNLPAGGTEDGEEIEGAFTTFGYYPTVVLRAIDITTDYTEETVQFVVGFRVPNVLAWLVEEPRWESHSLFTGRDLTNDPEFNVPLPRIASL